MTRGVRYFLLGSCLAAAGCSATTQDVKVRPIADPAAKFRYSGDLIGQARAQLALGNEGLALETFRKALREQPESADAFAGIAACYAAMGRYDLTRANYEFALAYTPNDPALLSALASTLDRLGQSEQAAEVRGEAARLAMRPAVQAPIKQVASTPVGVPKVGSVTVELPPAKPPAAAGRVVPTMTAATGGAPAASTVALHTLIPQTKTQVALRMPNSSPSGATHIAELPAVAAVWEPPVAIAEPRLVPAVVDLPPTRINLVKAHAVAAKAKFSIPETPQVLVEKEADAPRPVPVRKPRENEVAKVEALSDRGPHLERLSPGVVSLVTTAAPVQVTSLGGSRPEAPAKKMSVLVAEATPPSRPAPHPVLTAEVRWMPLKYASAPAIQLLNAARSEGLAARTRVALADRGWKKIRIGNARQVRQRSLVLYSPERASVGRRLAAQLRCKAMLRRGVNSVIVLLGRDRPAAARA